MKNNIIDFSKTGGYRFKQATLAKMQETYLAYLKALVSFLGCAETGNYVISGCEIVGTNITAGVMYIDGELCPFEQTTGTDSSLISKQVITTQLNFKNGVDQPVFRELKAVKVSSGGIALSAFTRFNYVQDSNYVHTDVNFTPALLAKLNGIAPGAEVNLNANWAETNPAVKSFIQNKPTGDLLTTLQKGTYIHGDLTSANQLVTITFPSVGTTNYTVMCQVTGRGSVWQRDAKVNAVVRDITKTPTSFQLSLCDYTNESVQDIRVDYFIIPN